jgi:hypothetical protein
MINLTPLLLFEDLKVHIESNHPFWETHIHNSHILSTTRLENQITELVVMLLIESKISKYDMLDLIAKRPILIQYIPDYLTTQEMILMAKLKQ